MSISLTSKVGSAIVLLFALPLLLNWTALEVLKLKTFDALIPEQEPSGYFAVLNITEADITKEGGYPLSRCLKTTVAITRQPQAQLFWVMILVVLQLKELFRT